MSSLATRTPQGTFKNLLQLDNTNSGISASLVQAQDGGGTNAPFYLSTTQFGAIAGTVTAPGWAFGTDSTSGLYSLASGRWAGVGGGATVPAFTVEDRRVGLTTGTATRVAIGMATVPGSGLYFSAANTLVMANASVAGMTWNPTGEVTNARQPMVLAYNSATQVAVRGNQSSATAPIVFDTEVVDRGGNFATTGVFTAPVGGQYHFAGNIALSAFPTGSAGAVVGISSSNRLYYAAAISAQSFTTVAFTGTANNLGLPFSVIIDMDAGDVANVNVDVAGGATTVNISGQSNLWTYLSIGLLA